MEDYKDNSFITITMSRSLACDSVQLTNLLQYLVDTVGSDVTISVNLV